MAMSTYEQVLQMTKHLELPEQLQLLEALSRIVRYRVEEKQVHSIMELEGLGAEIWQGIDAQEYVNQERDSIAQKAAEIRAAYGLRTPDAIQFATALQAGVTYFLTNDRGLRKFTEINVLVVNDLF